MHFVPFRILRRAHALSAMASLHPRLVRVSVFREAVRIEHRLEVVGRAADRRFANLMKTAWNLPIDE